jgi:histone H3/H4
VAKKRAARRETFVVASKVKSYVREKGFNVSSELVAELSNRAQELLDRAAKRCQGNGRRTVRTFDV